MDYHRVQALTLYSHVVGVCGIGDSLTLEWEVAGERSY